MLVTMLAAALIQPPAPAPATQDRYTTVSDVTVVARPIDPLLTVMVDGDLDVESLVRSDPSGVRCGAHEHRYAASGSPRLCWIRRPAGSEIVLSAHDVGSDWRVEWHGCALIDEGRRCRVTLNDDETEIRATYRRD
ncbi:MAG: hypothetical protein ACK4FB_03140 [Brevundimonas sp.]|uniref:hypothetical protein n=1 Tax=Brevundimonas sp. TaxID=1871086 RepID=UPI00391AEDFC